MYILQSVFLLFSKYIIATATSIQNVLSIISMLYMQMTFHICTTYQLYTLLGIQSISELNKLHK